jgi:hypothetical protein
MSSPRSLIARTTTALAVVASFATVASAEVVRVPAAAPPAPLPVADHAHFAQPPHAFKADRIDPIDRDEPAPLTRDGVREALLRARHRNLAAFHVYATAGIYPSNVYTPGALNVWRDQDGHFCAAATIIRNSGAIELTDRVADQNNFIRLADVTQGPLMDWILTSGFTQDEIVAIQKPFEPVVEKPVVAPEQHLAIDAKLRAAETARLKKVYAQVEHQLAANENKSIERAVDQLMKHPDLAWKIASAE